jgi:catechol 2,3-dioxygenase-like lactoylglutathione lyase family enzyme
MKIEIEHLALPAKDAAAMIEWYIKTLGASLVFNNGQVPPTALIRLGGAMLEIYAGDSSAPETANNKLCGWRHVALRVPSIAEAKATLESRGVRFTEAPRPAAGGGQVLFFADPEGNLLHLVERSADSVVK